MKNNYDVVIIGSGLGGLLCAYMLGKSGYKVAVLEKHHTYGGCLQTFNRRGYVFDTGMHYIGSLEQGQILYKLFNYLDLFKDITLQQLDKDNFDIVSFQGNNYPFAQGYDNFVKILSKQFPQEQQNIQRYIENIQKIAAASPINNLQEIEKPTFIDSDYIKKSVAAYIADFTTNRTLRNILAAPSLLYAGVPDKTPVYIHALLVNSYIASAWRIVGGSHLIADSLVKSITNFGGAVFTNAEVNQIICDEKKVTEVKTRDGQTYYADTFISNVHPVRTMELIDSRLIRNAYRRRLEEMENTISNFSLYLAFKPESMPYINHNIYHFEGDDVWNIQNYDDTTWPLSYLFLPQSRAVNEQYCQSIQIVTYMKMEDVSQWKNTTVGHRGEEYVAFKKQKAEKLIDKLEERFPDIRQHIAFYETSTPLTYRDYTATKDGSLFGVLRNCNFPVQTLVSQRTKIPNLFLTGQNINAHGFLGVSIGAIITCSEILGTNTIIKQI